MHDLVIRGATVVDGSGAARRVEDVAVSDGLIAEIRAYYLNRHAPYARRDFELDGFDYAGRGYPVLAE